MLAGQDGFNVNRLNDDGTTAMNGEGEELDDLTSKFPLISCFNWSQKQTLCSPPHTQSSRTILNNDSPSCATQSKLDAQSVEFTLNRGSSSTRNNANMTTTWAGGILPNQLHQSGSGRAGCPRENGSTANHNQTQMHKSIQSKANAHNRTDLYNESIQTNDLLLIYIIITLRVHCPSRAFYHIVVPATRQWMNEWLNEWMHSPTSQRPPPPLGSLVHLDATRTRQPPHRSWNGVPPPIPPLPLPILPEWMNEWTNARINENLISFAQITRARASWKQNKTWFQNQEAPKMLKRMQTKPNVNAHTHT